MCNTENRKYTYQGLFCKAIMKTANSKQDNPSGAALFAVLRFVQLPKNNCAGLIESLLPADSCLFKKNNRIRNKADKIA